MFQFENYCIDMLHHSVKDTTIGIVAIAPQSRDKTATIVTGCDNNE
jgi:hypothetical protein